MVGCGDRYTACKYAAQHDAESDVLTSGVCLIRWRLSLELQSKTVWPDSRSPSARGMQIMGAASFFFFLVPFLSGSLVIEGQQ